MTAKPRIIATTQDLTGVQIGTRTPSSMARVNSDYSMGYEDPRYSSSPNPFSTVRVIFPFSAHPKDSFLGDYLEHATIRRLSKSSAVRVDFQLSAASGQIPALLPQCEPAVGPTARTNAPDSQDFSDFLRWWLDSETGSTVNVKNDSNRDDPSNSSRSCKESPISSPKNSSALHSTFPGNASPLFGRINDRENQGSPTYRSSSPSGFLHDPRQSVVRRLTLELCQDRSAAVYTPSSTENSALSLPFPIHGLRPQYCVGTRCRHVDHWKRLRAKKGQIYYMCKVCGSKWRVPTRNTLMSKVLQEHHIQTQKELREQQQQYQQHPY